ncbi:MAG: phosphate transporter substrate-binding protein [Rhizobacter sp.]|nr:phosphate transporter substrate-binding protein [Rhizobacter sp.]
MYDVDRDAVRSWWHGLAAALRAQGLRGVPDALEWPQDLGAHWHDPNLLLGQTCGHPLVSRLATRVQVVGAFRYTAPGCSGIQYRSELLARTDAPGCSIEDFRGSIAAVNDRESHSGFHALRARVAPFATNGRFFASYTESGSHRASLALLQARQADVAAIDCVTLALLRRHAPETLAGLHVIGSTARAPGLPLITAARTTAEELVQLRRALRAACADDALRSVREALFIGGFVAAPLAAWHRITAMQAAGAVLVEA